MGYSRGTEVGRPVLVLVFVLILAFALVALVLAVALVVLVVLVVFKAEYVRDGGIGCLHGHEGR
ncbi:hypothetical protein AB0F36_27795 [Streptomyces sp. NPDC029080]|uniref:hypothetical protein n=1 Tax=Streptomyces sp. NPDC029080 TaxID=3155017 RepID=UPI00144E73AD|nr:hypothetical protein [Streptomyces sp. SID2955]